jgi:hypothetical protein
LGEHGAAGVVHRGPQVDLPAVLLLGAAEGLAVDRPQPPMPATALTLVRAWAGAVAVGQPRADHGGQQVGVQAAQGSADRGLGWDRPAGGGVSAGAERGPDRLRGIGGPLGDRGHRPGAGQHRGGGQSQDRGQRVAAATTPSRVRNRGGKGKQIGCVGRPERIGVAEVGGELSKGGWDRDRG